MSVLSHCPTSIVLHPNSISFSFYSLFSKMTKVRPAARLMQASAQCLELGAAYGQCVLKTYSNMSKDACEKEFLAFKTCVTKAFKK